MRVLVLSIGQRQRKRGHTGRVVSGQVTKRLVWKGGSYGGEVKGIQAECVVLVCPVLQNVSGSRAASSAEYGFAIAELEAGAASLTPDEDNMKNIKTYRTAGALPYKDETQIVACSPS